MENEFEDNEYLIIPMMAELEQQTLEVNEMLYSIINAEKILDSQFFRNKLKETLKNSSSVMNHSLKIMKDMTLAKRQFVVGESFIDKYFYNKFKRNSTQYI